MTDALDLGAYCARIGYTGARAPVLDVLRELHLRHTQAIAFENLNSFLGRPVSLELPALEEKLVRSRRGGYCFEQNALFAAVLEAMGFEVTRLAARVMWGAPPGTVRPRSHMCLKARVGGRDYLADVGFGGLTKTAPLLLASGEQKTPHETFRIEQIGEEFKVEANVAGEWRALYRFDLTPQMPVDYSYANYFVSTSPNSQFVTGLMLCRPFENGRYTLSNRALSIYSKNGEIEKREVKSGGELVSVLRELFLLDPPPDLEAAFPRLA